MKKLKVQRTYEWLQSEIEKDNLEIEVQKEKMIKEIKSLDKTKMFPVKEKISTFKKILIAFGYDNNKKR
jgi:hypothetical protein